MEEFWKDICVASFHDQRADYLSSATHAASRAIVLQDFLAKPFADDPSPPESSPASAPPGPSPLLSLSSGSDFPPTESAKSNPQFLAKKRSRETTDSSLDQKHERLIKNRESADRSRARKHAYTNKLELEIARLQGENAELRKHQEKIFVADTTQLPKKKNLQRTLTAPF